ncbi:hypothetical protein [Mucilaginibacter myungsuensis]|uniref:Uncharacterized protein n=1 Tax=Mucilaginibacter myungsuensis TaxID=649104 RepID=A0A929PVL9_9SPHI|nr:hypothetical protein [Mucilaginibacter myungsuensis]MBE9661161.1 hypothetical protein [Mucilaginibacter myungsuensis]MDN3597306.1 hypothetical protein [Mucilaginibacter myungsuensis]
MTKTLLTLITLFTIIFSASAQQKDLKKITDSIETEGKLLYNSEWASWHGSDIFHAKYPAKMSRSRGFLSYDTGKGMVNVIFTEGEDPTVLALINFGYDQDINKYQVDTTSRKFNKTEAELFKIRLASIKKIMSDTLVRPYNNANVNFVPIILNGEKRVYVLTGPKISGVVLFGNDCLIRFNKNDEIKSVEKQHKALIPITTRATDGQISDAGIHNHLDEYSPFMTAIDICTMMLYEKMTTWRQHIVTTKNYVSTWDCTANKLTIQTQDAWKKANEAKSKPGTSQN